MRFGQAATHSYENRRVQMMESLFGSTAPVWTTLPPTGFGLHAPIALGNGPIGPPLCAPPSVVASGAPAQPLPGPAPIPYGYSPGMIPMSPQSLGASPFPR